MSTSEIDRPGCLRRAPMRLRFAAGALVAVILLAGCGDDDSVDSADSDPAGVIEDYRIAYNNGDIDAVMALFSEESVVTGHPFSSESTGLLAIRNLHLQDIAAAAEEDAYEISNTEVSGDTVTWDHVWTNSAGDEYCISGQSAVIEDGKIVSWTWPDAEADCG